MCLERKGPLIIRGVLPLVAIVLPVVFSGCVSIPVRHVDAGPLYTLDRDLQGTPGTRMLGPLWERREAQDGATFTAVRPFWSRVEDPASERSVTDVIWPIGMFKTRKGELDWRLLPAFGHDFDTGTPASRHRWSVFPLLFGGRNREDEPYFAVFPLGGTLHEFLGRDRIVFVLFPLYAFSTVNELRTHSALWPVYSRTTGPDVYRFRVWPFYGVSVNEGRWVKRFVMWPFWTSVHYDFPDQKGGGFVLFPLYGRVEGDDRHSRMVLPPFFKYEWKGDEHRALNAPWPFIQYSRGETDKLYLWPLYGRKTTGRERQGYTLWPVFSWRHNERPPLTHKRFRALPLVFYEATHVTEPAEDGGARPNPDIRSRYFKLWPVLSYRREAGFSRFRALALWPLKHTPAVERNWAPLWSLYSRERNGDERQTELLWGLYRHRRGTAGRRLSVFPLLQTASDEVTASRSWSLLYGLAGYRRDGVRKSLGLLYFLNVGAGREQTGLETVGEHTEKEAEKP